MKLYRYDDGSVRETAFAESMDDLREELTHCGYDTDDEFVALWREMAPDETLTVRRDTSDTSDTSDTEGDGVRYTDETCAVAEWIVREGKARGFFTSSEW